MAAVRRLPDGVLLPVPTTPGQLGRAWCRSTAPGQVLPGGGGVMDDGP